MLSTISPKQIVRRLFARYGYEITPKRGLPRDFTEQDITLVHQVMPYTMTTPERIFGLRRAVEYISSNHISGAIVECGVWRGGSMMAIAKTLQQLDNTQYDLYLFDTFAGMPQPGEADGLFAQQKFEETKIGEDSSDWCYASLSEVKSVMDGTGYNQAKFHFVQGKVEETIPANAPDQIALLRLDTDWYESTKHELIHLFPRLSIGGVIIIDDYGKWAGARQAVDEYLLANNISLLLNRLDDTARIGVKTA